MLKTRVQNTKIRTQTLMVVLVGGSQNRQHAQNSFVIMAVLIVSVHFGQKHSRRDVRVFSHARKKRPWQMKKNQHPFANSSGFFPISAFTGMSPLLACKQGQSKDTHLTCNGLQRHSSQVLKMCDLSPAGNEHCCRYVRA